MLRQIKSIRKSLTPTLSASLVTSLVFSRIDYCAPLLCGLSSRDDSRLQSIINASARLVLKQSSRAHILPLLKSLQWLPASARIDLRLAPLTFKCLNHRAPEYFSETLTPVSTLPGRSNLRSASSFSLAPPRVRLSSVSKKFFPTAAARVWNRFPSQVSAITDLTVFKNAAKQFFIDDCFT